MRGLHTTALPSRERRSYGPVRGAAVHLAAGLSLCRNISRGLLPTIRPTSSTHSAIALQRDDA